jgi:hypothetical protein
MQNYQSFDEKINSNKLEMAGNGTYPGVSKNGILAHYFLPNFWTTYNGSKAIHNMYFAQFFRV